MAARNAQGCQNFHKQMYFTNLMISLFYNNVWQFVKTRTYKNFLKRKIIKWLMVIVMKVLF